MICASCGGPVHYTPEESDSAYGQAFHLCRRYPTCRGGAHVGPSEHDIYRREHQTFTPQRTRPVAAQLEGDWR